MPFTVLGKLLERAEDPRAIRGIAWGLERLTGVSSKAITLSDARNIESRTEDATWYQRNGFYQLAGQYGYSSSSYSGIAVTPEVALQTAVVYACVKILGEDIGGLPFKLYSRNRETGDTKELREHPLYSVLKNLPNPETSSSQFREAMTATAALTGDAYARIERTKGGRVFLWQYPFESAVVTRDKNSVGQTFWVVKEGNSIDRTFEFRDVFHLPGFSFSGANGDPILRRACHIIGLTASGQEYAARHFAQDATPPIVITHPRTADVYKLKQAWLNFLQKRDKWHEPGVLSEGATATVLQYDHQKTQLIEQRKFQIEEMARLYRMPLHRLQMLDRMTNNNVEQLGIDYVTGTLSPWDQRWSDAVYRCLLTPDEQARDEIYATHTFEKFLRGDFATQTTGFRALLEKGVYSINEVRRWLNLNSIGPDGDKHYVQLNMADVSSTAAQIAGAQGGANASA